MSLYITFIFIAIISILYFIQVLLLYFIFIALVSILYILAHSYNRCIVFVEHIFGSTKLIDYEIDVLMMYNIYESIEE